MTKEIFHETSKEQYEGMAREDVFRLRALIPVFEKSVLRGGEKPWDLESWQKIRDQFLLYVEKSGKKLEEFGTTNEELKMLESRVAATQLLGNARHSCYVMGPNKVTEHEAKRLINTALQAMGSNLEEIEELKKPSEKRRDDFRFPQYSKG